MKLIKHFMTISKHKWYVFKYCFKSGLFFQGLVHDLSKYSFTEFFKGVKYFNGKRSPIGVERRTIGYSKAWLHHKGRNKHHPEYWIDLDLNTMQYVSIVMPKRYVAECFLDHLAASKVYNKKDYKKELLYDYYHQKEKAYVPMHTASRKLFEMLLDLYMEKGEKEVFKYIKKNLKNSEVNY